MILALIRHGQTDWNLRDLLQGSSDIPLNETGRQQARDAAAGLAGGGWEAIVSSPLARARETAEIIAAELGIELGGTYPQLAERDYGALEGDSSKAAIEAYPRRDYPGAETLADVVVRGRAGVDAIASDHLADRTLVVAHGTIIRYTLASIAGHAVSGIRNGEVSTIEGGPGAWTVLTVNGEPCVEVDAADAGGWSPGLAG